MVSTNEMTNTNSVTNTKTYTKTTKHQKDNQALPVGDANFEEVSAAGDGVNRVNIQAGNLDNDCSSGRQKKIVIFLRHVSPYI